MMQQQQQQACELFVCFLVALSCFPLPGLAQPPELPQEEGEFSCSYIRVCMCVYISLVGTYKDSSMTECIGSFISVI